MQFITHVSYKGLTGFGGSRNALWEVFLVSWRGVRLSLLGTSATISPMVPAPDDRWGECGQVGGMRIGRGNRSYRRKPAPVLLSTTNLTWPDLDSNPGRRSEKPATNRLTYGTAFFGKLIN
jgi:hypothetical protein